MAAMQRASVRARAKTRRIAGTSGSRRAARAARASAAAAARTSRRHSAPARTPSRRSCAGGRRACRVRPGNERSSRRRCCHDTVQIQRLVQAPESHPLPCPLPSLQCCADCDLATDPT